MLEPAKFFPMLGDRIVGLTAGQFEGHELFEPADFGEHFLGDRSVGDREPVELAAIEHRAEHVIVDRATADGEPSHFGDAADRRPLGPGAFDHQPLELRGVPDEEAGRGRFEVEDRAEVWQVDQANLLGAADRGTGEGGEMFVVDDIEAGELGQVGGDPLERWARVEHPVEVIAGNRAATEFELFDSAIDDEGTDLVEVQFIVGQIEGADPSIFSEGCEVDTGERDPTQGNGWRAVRFAEGIDPCLGGRDRDGRRDAGSVRFDFVGGEFEATESATFADREVAEVTGGAGEFGQARDSEQVEFGEPSVPREAFVVAEMSGQLIDRNRFAKFAESRQVVRDERNLLGGVEFDGMKHREPSQTEFERGGIRRQRLAREG